VVEGAREIEARSTRHETMRKQGEYICQVSHKSARSALRPESAVGSAGSFRRGSALGFGSQVPTGRTSATHRNRLRVAPRRAHFRR
jgi:hypothetical protein